MKYSALVEVYDSLAGTTKRLQKALLLGEFLKKSNLKEDASWVYLLKGRVLPEYDVRELGVSTQLVIKMITQAFSANEGVVQEKFSKKGDLGEVALELAEKSKQSTLFSSKPLDVKDVVSGLQGLLGLEGKGTVGRKVELAATLLRRATPREALYITRTLLSDLRIGVADSLLLDALAYAFFDNNKEARQNLEDKYLLTNDLGIIAKAAATGDTKALKKISLQPGIPSQVMLSTKVKDIEEGFEACGKPAVFEYKYDGFRVLIHKKGDRVWLFTRRLENVTAQFPDVVEVVKQNIKGESFIFDSEVVGYDAKTKKYQPFEYISQRIRRKYNIAELQTKLPVEVNIFDVLYYNGENCMEKPLLERRKLVEKVVPTKKLVLRPAIQLITDDAEKAQAFYEKALSEGEEGVMIKRQDAPYCQGRYVGYMVKLKPILQDLDLVIVGAEYGTGKRGGWFTSYIVACRGEDGDFIEVGKVSSGLKEKEEEGMTYKEMTALIKEIITEEKEGYVSVKPKLVVAVNYQNIQKSPAYTSGYALRFPRITAYRPDRTTSDIATIDDIERAFKASQR
jgi:DNA ligase 1